MVGGLKVIGSVSTELVKTIELSVVEAPSRVVATSSGFSDDTDVSGDLVSVVSKVVEGSEVSSCSGSAEVVSVVFNETSVVELAVDGSSVKGEELEVPLPSVDDTDTVEEGLVTSLGKVEVASDSEVDVEDVVVAGRVTSGGQGRSFDVVLLIDGRVVKTDELSDVYSVDSVDVCVSSGVYSPVTTDDDDKSVFDDVVLLKLSVAADEISVDALRSSTSRVVEGV